jgi:hypothetical protein
VPAIVALDQGRDHGTHGFRLSFEQPVMLGDRLMGLTG